MTKQLVLSSADWLEEHGLDDEALVQRSWTKEKQEAEDYMWGIVAQNHHHNENYGYEDYYDESEGEYRGGELITYEQLIQAGWDYIEGGKNFHQLGSESLRDSISGEEYWKYWRELTGYKKEIKKESWANELYPPFSCSC